MSSRTRREDLDAKVYIGGLPDDATVQEIEDLFRRYGRIHKTWVARRPPGFGFVIYEDARDAEDAAKALDGTRICGVRARVEMSHGRHRNGAAPRHNNARGGGYGGGRGGGGGGRYNDNRGRSRSRSPRPRDTRERSPRDRSPQREVRKSYSRSRSRSRSIEK
jgi:RNA recognition motif-containing protein